MNKKDAIKLIDEKIADLKTNIEATKRDTTISKNTRGTKLYALSRERRTMDLLKDILSLVTDKDRIALPDESLSTLVLLTTLSSERVVRTGIEAAVGDNAWELIKKYPNKSIDKIERQLNTKGLSIDQAKMVVVELKK